MWNKGDRVQASVYDSSRGYSVIRRGTVVRNVVGLRGRELTEVLFDSPPRSEPTEIIAFTSEQLQQVKREKKTVYNLRQP